MGNGIYQLNGTKENTLFGVEEENCIGNLLKEVYNLPLDSFPTFILPKKIFTFVDMVEIENEGNNTGGVDKLCLSLFNRIKEDSEDSLISSFDEYNFYYYENGTADYLFIENMDLVRMGSVGLALCICNKCLPDLK